MLDLKSRLFGVKGPKWPELAFEASSLLHHMIRRLVCRIDVGSERKARQSHDTIRLKQLSAHYFLVRLTLQSLASKTVSQTKDIKRL